MTNGPDFNILSTNIYVIQITNDFFSYLKNVIYYIYFYVLI